MKRNQKQLTAPESTENGCIVPSARKKFPKRPPTEKQMREDVAAQNGVYGGMFPHPLKDNEDYERFYALKAPRNMLMVEAIWHRKKCFVFFIPCEFPDYKVKGIQTMASYEDSGPLYTHKKPGVRDLQASRKAKAEKVGC